MTKAILNWNGKVELSNDKTLRIGNLGALVSFTFLISGELEPFLLISGELEPSCHLQILLRHWRRILSLWRTGQFWFLSQRPPHILWNDVSSTAFYILGVLDEVWLMDLWWVHGMIYNAIKFLFLSNNFPSSWTCGTWTSCRQTTASALPWTWGVILLHSPTSCCLCQRVCCHHACQGLLHLHWVGCDGGSSAEEWEILSLLRGLIRNIYQCLQYDKQGNLVHVTNTKAWTY